MDDKEMQGEVMGLPAPIPDEVRLRNAEAELFDALAAIFAKHQLPESLSVLMMRSVLLDLMAAQSRVIAQAVPMGGDE